MASYNESITRLRMILHEYDRSLGMLTDEEVIAKALQLAMDMRLSQPISRNEIIKQLGKYFGVKELVCPHIFKKFGENSWRFLDTDYLHCLLILRKDIFQAPMTCNTKAMTQRGMRCNCCDLVKSKKDAYISSHILGKAGDFDVKGLTAEEARQKIKDNADLLPCKCRVEAGVTWLHFDTMPHDHEEMVHEFIG